MKLVHLNDALTSSSGYSPEQIDDIQAIFKALFHGFSVCMSVRYVQGIAQFTHDKYIDELRTRLISVVERVYNHIPFLLFKDKESITEALRKDLDIIAKDAKGDPKTFSHHC